MVSLKVWEQPGEGGALMMSPCMCSLELKNKEMMVNEPTCPCLFLWETVCLCWASTAVSGGDPKPSISSASSYSLT